MKLYVTPNVYELGSMAAVTRKSGGISDIDDQQTGSNLPAWQQFLCFISGGAFDFCSLDGPGSAPTQQGSGSFNA